MVLEAFLIAALSLPSPQFTWPRMVSYQMAKSEEERLKDWLHKNNPEAQIVIHPNPPTGKLKEQGFESVPFTWRGNKIWIRRKPASDQKKLQESA